jgi:hypothetical protein
LKQKEREKTYTNYEDTKSEEKDIIRGQKMPKERWGEKQE